MTPERSVPRTCIFEGCVSTDRHWHGGFPGGYDNPADPDGPPIEFTSEPEPGVRDYNGALLDAWYRRAIEAEAALPAAPAGVAQPLDGALHLAGPVAIAESLTDPGDMGEPRVFESDGVTYVTVPDRRLWAEPAGAGLREALEWAIERLQGSIHGMTVNKDKSVTAGMEDSDGTGLWQGEWVQKGVVIHAIRAALVNAGAAPALVEAAVTALAKAWRDMNRVAFIDKDAPHGHWGPPSDGTEAIYASNFLATLNAAGWTLAANAGATPTLDVERVIAAIPADFTPYWDAEPQADGSILNTFNRRAFGAHLVAAYERGEEQ